MQGVLKQAVEMIQTRWQRQPRFGIILGTGAAEVVRQFEVEERILYSEITGFPESTVIGHIGQWICGRLAGQPVIAMQGRFHLYEGYSIEQVELAITTMQRVGVKTLLVSNAAGGVNPCYRSGDLMAIDSHLNFMFHRTSILPSRESERVGRSGYYDEQLIDDALGCARKNEFVMHRGVYASMLGPNYETRAEYRMLQKLGADVVGMSTVPEVIAANRLGLRVLAVSIVGNVANPDDLEEITGQGVIDAAGVAAPRLCTLFVDAIRRDSPHDAE